MQLQEINVKTIGHLELTCFNTADVFTSESTCVTEYLRDLLFIGFILMEFVKLKSVLMVVAYYVAIS